MAKRIYQEGEPCDVCGTPTIAGKFGAYCKPCYIAYKNAQEGMRPAVNGNVPTSPKNPAQVNFRPQGGYQKQPPKDFKATMDYKGNQISKMQDNKEESMRLFSSGRDATMIVSTQYNGNLPEEEMKVKIKEWRDWFYQNIYKMDEDEYKVLNSPF